ncbi:hypothetical protein K461DRAFT_289619 [Myriangium duriaei CBS 260.36]|uniref:Uncharacterized protein n=1 Tax=Myriangium duriaei CBS 260.36 TaxID=1168546 RepID=A0A9P4J981_9PEZI|nr:hypothetical protein K461DRAFT_289619 [Myriangium duriaei CBS 260.36]
MVLEEASGFDPAQDQGDAYGDSGQQFDSNGRTFVQQDQNQWAINFDSLPKPWGVLTPIDWRSSPHRTALLTAQLRQAQAILERPLRQEEVDAVTYSFAKSIQMVSYTIPASLLGGAAMTYRGADKFSVPFIRLSERAWFNPEKFGPLVGKQARVAWHSVRFSTWGALAMVLAGGFFGSMANSTAMSSLLGDPRMKDLKEKMQKSGGNMRPAVPPPSQRSSIETQEGQMDNQAVRAESMWRRTRNQQRSSQQNDDDVSPTGGAGMSEDTGLLSDSQMQMNERRQEYEAATAERNARNRAQQEQRPQQQQSRWPQQQSEQSGAGSSTAPGSSWERLRRDAANRPANAPRQDERRSSSSVGEDFTFSHRDEDRQLAQQEAQKDFDARVERERQGGEFNSNSRGRW